MVQDFSACIPLLVCLIETATAFGVVPSLCEILDESPACLDCCLLVVYLQLSTFHHSCFICVYNCLSETGTRVTIAQL